MLAKMPKLVKRIFPERVWSIPNEKKEIFLTFDDGPIPEVTPWVLARLKEYDAKASFFCIGENIVKYPEILQQVISDGHCIGNHSQNHLNGWKTPSEKYFQNVLKAEAAIETNFPENENAINPKTKIFRPPYGRITSKQVKLLQQKNYKIIMWDVLSMDYNQNITPEKCFKNVIRNAISGSIIVFHDSRKAEKNLRVVLPLILKHYQKKGFSFGKIEF